MSVAISANPPANVDAVSTKRLVIVGGGMAAHGLCKRLIEHSDGTEFEITLFGEEPRPAYDRVNLSSLMSGSTEDDLLLSPKEWYQQHKIRLQVGRRITALDPEQQVVTDDTGAKHTYDQLVLATGSYPWVPPIEGTKQRGVFVYRTIDDLQAIQQYVQQTSAKTSAVIGGGLLGLEAAKVIQNLGLRTTILEVAPGLMPRQLDAQGAKVLREKVQELGVDVHVTRRTESIVAKGSQLSLNFQNAEPLDVEIVLVAAGIRPRDELAHDAGLKLGPRGGIAVNRHLETSVPNVYAIGECAAVDGHIHGLVAPCYRMADVLAARLFGEPAVFNDTEESVELKLLGVPVITLGKAIGESTSGVVVTHDGDEGHRKLLLEQGRMVGAASVGHWEDVDLIRMSVAQHKRLWPTQRVRFVRTGTPYVGGTGLPIAQWPGHATVCSCMGITRQQLGTAISEGHQSAPAMSLATGAGTACGTCRNLLCELAGETATPTRVSGATMVLVSSILSVLVGLIVLLAPPIPLATSVQDPWREIDILWRDDFLKQVSGYSLLACFVLALTFSMRKRLRFLQWGNYGWWRAAHASIGTLMAMGLIAHTGIRMGDHLNFALSLTFVLLTIVGGLAGITSALENRLTGDSAMFVRAWRPKLTWMHIVLFVPMPALLAGHILSVYWY
ncbi:FAD-dependent oxidoreductase [Rhodopirellula sp. JC740]|uniref:FAD-dependent oxidoreductase n=1 Tax=Rhodopirellula halodulae TaxID=2894198 RepID=A0ABS8NE31_9BACT|nr:FAD-dependent oxidoreductase [Rhodopirellula sp. JC740]MCC9640721.1 FAD-dependent oxidoreductase [Rhodopirellula sp. JC740]